MAMFVGKRRFDLQSNISRYANVFSQRAIVIVGALDLEEKVEKYGARVAFFDQDNKLVRTIVK